LLTNRPYPNPYEPSIAKATLESKYAPPLLLVVNVAGFVPPVETISVLAVAVPAGAEILPDDVIMLPDVVDMVPLPLAVILPLLLVARLLAVSAPLWLILVPVIQLISLVCVVDPFCGGAPESIMANSWP
jgi:hypothetical protein